MPSTTTSVIQVRQAHANDRGRIAMLLPNLRGDGAVGMMLALADGFASHGYRVDVLATNARGERGSSIPAAVRLIDLHAPRPLRAVPAITRYLRQEHPDMLMASEHYSGLPALYALNLARTNTRCIIRQDNTWGMDSRRFKGRHRFLTPWMVGRLFRRAEIVAVSNGVAADLIRHFPHLTNNVQTIYNPVIADELVARGKAKVEHPWFAPSEPPVVVAVGRLTAAKGFDLLIEAFHRATSEVTARLLILGEGPDRPELEAKIQTLGLEARCSLAGFQPNPMAFLSKAAVFVLSSRFEGLPTVLIEAMAVGTPVISTDCPSGPREILANGKYGTLVEPENIDALAHAIIKHITKRQEPQPDMGNWLQQFSVEASVEKHLALFEASLVSPPPQRRHAPLNLTSRKTSR